MNWLKVTHINDIPEMGSRKVIYKDVEIALFKTKNAKIFAVNNTCPHKQGKLSEGIVHDEKITCPMHNWVIDLPSGEALGEDCGCTQTYETKIENDLIYIKL
jgi:nitrite reductase (NADH) small subunit